MGVHAFEGGWRGYVVAPIWRDNVRGGGESSLGARLRTRKVTGRDASLPAPFVERVWHNWLPVEQLGHCPKPHQRRRLWTPQGAIAP